MAVSRGQRQQFPSLGRDDGSRGEISQIRDLRSDVCVRVWKSDLLLRLLHLAGACLHDGIHDIVLELQEL